MAPPATLKGFARADGPLRSAGDYTDLTPTEQQEVVRMIDEHLSERMHEGTMQRVRRIQAKDIQGLELFVAGISGASEACTSGKAIKNVLQDLRTALATEAETDDEVVAVDKPDWLTEPLVAVAGAPGSPWKSVLFVNCPGRDDDIFAEAKHPGAVGALTAEHVAASDLPKAVSYTHLTLPTTPYV